MFHWLVSLRRESQDQSATEVIVENENSHSHSGRRSPRSLIGFRIGVFLGLPGTSPVHCQREGDGYEGYVNCKTYLSTCLQRASKNISKK